MLHRQTAQIPSPSAERRTVIPTPRNDAMFPGWGVKF